VTDGEIDYAASYCALRGRVIALIQSATDEQLNTHAPATPEWRTRDVLAHMTGVTTDVLTGNLDGVGTDPWTKVQVDARRDRPVADLLAEWEKNGPQIDPMIASFGVVAGQFLTDSVTHEHDIRGALDTPGARDSDGLAIGFAWLGYRVGEMRDAAEVGALRVETEVGPYTFGSGEPSETCATSRFDFVRASTGRRSVEQIAAWDWDGELRPDLLVMPIFVPRPDPLVE
jgi:uncharacterized protein (TIGR03083 family)